MGTSLSSSVVMERWRMGLATHAVGIAAATPTGGASTVDSRSALELSATDRTCCTLAGLGQCADPRASACSGQWRTEASAHAVRQPLEMHVRATSVQLPRSAMGTVPAIPLLACVTATMATAPLSALMASALRALSQIA